MSEPMMRDVEHVAALLSLSPEYVRNQCRNHKIKAHKIGKRWLIPEAEVDRLLLVDSVDSKSKTELLLTKLEAENRTLRSQLNALHSLINGASAILSNDS